MIDIKVLEMLYFQNDFDCPYKTRDGYELKISPIKVKDWSIFEYSMDILQLDKNSVNDIEIIQMSYLDYLFKLIKDEAEVGISQYAFQEKLGSVFVYSMNEPYIAMGENKGKSCIILYDEYDNIKGTISSKEFEEISKIILYQNLISYDDRYMSQDIKDAIQEYYRIQSKMSDNVQPTLEKKKAFVISKTGILMNELNEMTYRTFGQVYDSCVDTDIYIGRKIIQGSYKYEVKEDVKHPLFEKEVDVIDRVFGKDADNFVKEVNQVNG